MLTLANAILITSELVRCASLGGAHTLPYDADPADPRASALQPAIAAIGLDSGLLNEADLPCLLVIASLSPQHGCHHVLLRAASATERRAWEAELCETLETWARAAAAAEARADGGGGSSDAPLTPVSSPRTPGWAGAAASGGSEHAPSHGTPAAAVALTPASSFGAASLAATSHASDPFPRTASATSVGGASGGGGAHGGGGAYSGGGACGCGGSGASSSNIDDDAAPGPRRGRRWSLSKARGERVLAERLSVDEMHISVYGTLERICLVMQERSLAACELQQASAMAAHASDAPAPSTERPSTGGLTSASFAALHGSAATADDAHDSGAAAAAAVSSASNAASMRRTKPVDLSDASDGAGGGASSERGPGASRGAAAPSLCASQSQLELEDVETFASFTGVDGKVAAAFVHEGRQKGLSLDQMITEFFDDFDQHADFARYREMGVSELLRRANSFSSAHSDAPPSGAPSDGDGRLHSPFASHSPYGGSPLPSPRPSRCAGDDDGERARRAMASAPAVSTVVEGGGADAQSVVTLDDAATAAAAATTAAAAAAAAAACEAVPPTVATMGGSGAAGGIRAAADARGSEGPNGAVANADADGGGHGGGGGGGGPPSLCPSVRHSSGDLDGDDGADLDPSGRTTSAFAHFTGVDRQTAATQVAAFRQRGLMTLETMIETFFEASPTPSPHEISSQTTPSASPQASAPATAPPSELPSGVPSATPSATPSRDASRSRVLLLPVEVEAAGRAADEGGDAAGDGDAAGGDDAVGDGADAAGRSGALSAQAALSPPPPPLLSQTTRSSRSLSTAVPPTSEGSWRRSAGLPRLVGVDGTGPRLSLVDGAPPGELSHTAAEHSLGGASESAASSAGSALSALSPVNGLSPVERGRPTGPSASWPSASDAAHDAEIEVRSSPFGGGGGGGGDGSGGLCGGLYEPSTSRQSVNFDSLMGAATGRLDLPDPADYVHMAAGHAAAHATPTLTRPTRAISEGSASPRRSRGLFSFSFMRGRDRDRPASRSVSGQRQASPRSQ